MRGSVRSAAPHRSYNRDLQFKRSSRHANGVHGRDDGDRSCRCRSRHRSVYASAGPRPARSVHTTANCRRPARPERRLAGAEHGQLRHSGASSATGAGVDPAPSRTGIPGLVRATPIDLPAAPVRALGAVGGVPAGEGVVEGDEIPYQPWAAAKKKENAEHWLERDPEIKCFMPGVPRATYMPYPFQILQGTNKILIAYEFAGTTRTIHMDKVPDSPSTTWMGWSRGRWEGDTLVVDVTDFNDQTWFDRAGNFHSDALHVIERYTPVSPYHLMYEVTIEDPKVFTRPWKMRMPLYRRLEQGKQTPGIQVRRVRRRVDVRTARSRRSRNRTVEQVAEVGMKRWSYRGGECAGSRRRDRGRGLETLCAIRRPRVRATRNRPPGRLRERHGATPTFKACGDTKRRFRSNVPRSSREGRR